MLLHGQMGVLFLWNVLPSLLMIVASELVIAFLVKVVTLRIEEVAAWKNIETILVILSRSVLDLLPGVFLHFWNFHGLRLSHRHTILRHHIVCHRIAIFNNHSRR